MLSIQTPYSHKVIYEVNSGECLVEPDDRAWTLKELVQRHAEGKLTDLGRTVKRPIYHDADHTSPDMAKVMASDLHEREMHVKEAKERVTRVRQRVKERKGKTAPKPTTPVDETLIVEKVDPKEESKKS